MNFMIYLNLFVLVIVYIPINLFCDMYALGGLPQKRLDSILRVNTNIKLEGQWIDEP